MDRDPGVNEIMTFDEYLDFLDQYWEIFGPIVKDSKDIKIYTRVLL